MNEKHSTNATGIAFLEGWYLSQCDGDWEHQHGIRICTLDNPGWSIDIDLDETDLAGVSLALQTVERGEHDWLHIEVKDRVFRCRGGPRNLSEMLTAFSNVVEGRPPFGET